MPDTPKPMYRQEFDQFMSTYNSGGVDAEAVGSMIVKLAQHFCDANQTMSFSQRVYNAQYATVINSEDENGKPMSAAKAKILIDASDEGKELVRAKAELENIEQLINALKYMQRGMVNEYAHIGGAN